MTPLLRKFLTMNWFLVAVIVTLGSFGILAIHDAGNNPGWDNLPTVPPNIQGDWKKQQRWFGLGIIAFFLTALIDYRLWRYLALPAYLGSLLLLVLTLQFGTEINGTKGWLDLPGPLPAIQPSQLAIASAVLLIAFAFEELPKNQRWGQWFENPWMMLVLAGSALGIPCLLVLKAGDIGSALVWLPVCFVLLLVGRIPFTILLNLLLFLAMALPIGYFLLIHDDTTRAARIEVWLDMNQGREVNIRDEAYAAHHIRSAIGSAGWDGKGRLNPDSVHGNGRIPQTTAHSDFIFAVIGEQWGFRGSAALLIGFSSLLFLCLLSALFARDQAGRLLCAGTMAIFIAHIFQNIGMCVLLVPITGIPLPLISYGGTFTLIIYFLLGLVQSVWIHREPVSVKSVHQKVQQQRQEQGKLPDKTRAGWQLPP